MSNLCHRQTHVCPASWAPTGAQCLNPLGPHSSEPRAFPGWGVLGWSGDACSHPNGSSGPGGQSGIVGQPCCPCAPDLALFWGPLAEPPVRILQPWKAPPTLQACTGETVTLACELSRVSASVQWAKDGAWLEAGGSLILEEEGAHRRLVIPAAGPEHSGKYVCNVGNDARTFTVQVSGELDIRCPGLGWSEGCCAHDLPSLGIQAVTAWRGLGRGVAPATGCVTQHTVAVPRAGCSSLLPPAPRAQGSCCSPPSPAPTKSPCPSSFPPRDIRHVRCPALGPLLSVSPELGPSSRIRESTAHSRSIYCGLLALVCLLLLPE